METSSATVPLTRLSRYLSDGFLSTTVIRMVATTEVSEIGHQLRRFALHRDRWIDALCRHVGVSRTDYDALEILDEHGSLTPSELGKLLTLTSGSVTALIDRLEKHGWASRTRHSDDRRKIIITLTQNAWQIGQAELEPYLDAVDGTARQLGPDARAVIVGFLDQLIDNVAHAPRPTTRGESRAMPSTVSHLPGATPA
jgi:DNA-binding MarR family transcriptional regulator